jgi:hypothetical protein
LWVHVIPHFEQFLPELQLSLEERIDAEGKAERIARSLAKKYYPDNDFNPDCYVIVGSHGKHTAVAPHSDLDMLFLLPPDVYYRIKSTAGNVQSNLLREVRTALIETFPNTDLRADGQIILAPFLSYDVEVVPAFINPAGGYFTGHTGNGGCWRLSNPAAEFEVLKQADLETRGKATHLLQMLKAWKRECNVELKSVSLEVLACKFVRQWKFRDRSIFYYDWMILDFFEFLKPYVNGKTLIWGTEEWIDLGDLWATKCETAYGRALKACEYERLDYGDLAAYEWQKIFGSQFHAKPIGLYFSALAGAVR